MQRLGSSPLVRAPEAARRPLQQARPNHVCAAWSPRAGAGGGGWAAAAGTLLGRRVHTDTPAPRQLGSSGEAARRSPPPLDPATVAAAKVYRSAAAEKSEDPPKARHTEMERLCHIQRGGEHTDGFAREGKGWEPQ